LPKSPMQRVNACIPPSLPDGWDSEFQRKKNLLNKIMAVP
jgi:hypothetical protein